MAFEKDFFYLAAASAAAVLGAGFDIRSRRIPNFITGPAILLGLVAHTAVDGWHGLGSSLAAMLIGGVIFLLFYIAGGMGAGDVKLMAAAGALVGLPHVSYVLILTSLAGGVMAIGLAMLKGRLKETILNMGSLAAHHGQQGLTPHPEINVLNQRQMRLPYGVAIAAGVLLTVYLQGAQGGIAW